MNRKVHLKAEWQCGSVRSTQAGCRGRGIPRRGGLSKVAPQRGGTHPEASATLTLEISPVNRMRTSTQKTAILINFAKVSAALL